MRNTQTAYKGRMELEKKRKYLELVELQACISKHLEKGVGHMPLYVHSS